MTVHATQQPTDLFPGAVAREDGSVSFALYAPGKASVSVIGDFNGWDRSANQLNSTEGGLWWTTLELGEGRHHYQFAVDGELVICDPYARLLAESAEHDPPRAIVEVGGQHYQWRHDGWQRPLFHELSIYELHLGSFTPEGTIAAALGRLDYLRDLGVNAVELMPVFDFAGEKTWGYNPTYFFTVEHSYGSTDELKQFIDECHARGIAVILDLVLAHTSHTHPFNKLYPYDQSPWYGTPLGEQNQFGFPSFDYSKGPAMAFARDVQHFWLREFHVDGFRYDYLLGLGMRDGMGLPYLVQSAREARADVYLIGEYSPENPMAVNDSGLDGAWRVGFRYQLYDLLSEERGNPDNWNDFSGTLQGLLPQHSGYESAARGVNFVESHDEERLVRGLQAYGFDEAAARFKSALAATVLFTMPGEPMLYSGQEFGEAHEKQHTERLPISWELLDTDGGRGLFLHYQKLAWLRRHHPALQGEAFSIDLLSDGQKVAVVHRWNDQGDDLIVALNFCPAPQTVTIPFPAPGRWRDELGGTEIDVDREYALEIPATSGMVFVKQ